MFSTRSSNEKRGWPQPATILLALALATICFAVRARAQDAGCVPSDGPAVIARLATIHLEVEMQDGRLLRLSGVEAPRGASDRPDLPRTAAATLNGWIAGRALPATIVAGDADRWGRHAARLTLPESDDGPTRDLAVAIIAAGLARVDPVDAPPECLAALLVAEGQARQGGLGVWASPAYAVLRADDRPTLERRAGEIVLVEGRVASVGKGRAATFLNMGRRGDLAIVAPLRVSRLMERAGAPADGYRGARVRVRGVLQTVPALRIEIASPAAIERLE